jgi:cytochrome b subunit of formate dehydrogenase
VLAGLLGLDMRRPPPSVEQFTYYQTTVSFPIWVILLGLIILTGLAKAMRYVYPIPGEVLWWASTLHVAGLILLAAKLLDHLRYVFNPDRWLLLKGMISGWVERRYVEQRHPGWQRAIEAAAGSTPADALSESGSALRSTVSSSTGRRP